MKTCFGSASASRPRELTARKLTPKLSHRIADIHGRQWTTHACLEAVVAVGGALALGFSEPRTGQRPQHHRLPATAFGFESAPVLRAISSSEG